MTRRPRSRCEIEMWKHVAKGGDEMGQTHFRRNDEHWVAGGVAGAWGLRHGPAKLHPLRKHACY